MKKKTTSLIIIMTLIFITCKILLNSSHILNTVSFSFEIWKNNIFPSLFPFFIISELLINYGFVELTSELLKPFMNLLFRINSNTSFILIMSLISGFPSSAKYTKELYLQKLITKAEAEKILMFTHFANPLFILGTVAIIFLKSISIGLLILVSHYLGNLFIGIWFRNLNPSIVENNHISLNKAINAMHMRRISMHCSFGKVLTNAITSTINTLLIILGTVTCFLVLMAIIEQTINIDHAFKAILSGILEMTQGLKFSSMLEVSLLTKSILTGAILSFGGLSVHFQVISILSDTDISYKPFLLARLIHPLITAIIIYILFDYWLLIF